MRRRWAIPQLIDTQIQKNGIFIFKNVAVPGRIVGFKVYLGGPHIVRMMAVPIVVTIRILVSIWWAALECALEGVFEGSFVASISILKTPLGAGVL